MNVFFIIGQYDIRIFVLFQNASHQSNKLQEQLQNSIYQQLMATGMPNAFYGSPANYEALLSLGNVSINAIACSQIYH